MNLSLSSLAHHASNGASTQTHSVPLNNFNISNANANGLPFHSNLGLSSGVVPATPLTMSNSEIAVPNGEFNGLRSSQEGLHPQPRNPLAHSVDGMAGTVSNGAHMEAPGNATGSHIQPFFTYASTLNGYKIKHYLVQPNDTSGSKRTLPDFLNDCPQFTHVLQLNVGALNTTTDWASVGMPTYKKQSKDQALEPYYSKRGNQSPGFIANGYDPL